jgi:hypothetical protein
MEHSCFIPFTEEPMAFIWLKVMKNRFPKLSEQRIESNSGLLSQLTMALCTTNISIFSAFVGDI